MNAGIQSASGSKLSPQEIFLNELQPDIPVLWDGMRMDAFTHGYALEHMKKNQPRVMFISYGETDDLHMQDVTTIICVQRKKLMR